MNFPQRFIAFTAIVFWIVLFLLCGHSRAAPAVRFKKCTSDYECNQGEFCRPNSGTSYCALCLDCNRYNREPSRRCARLRTDCGPCQPGFGEFGPHCRQLVKEIVTGYITDQTFKPGGMKPDQPEGFSRWLVVPGVVVIVMAIGVVAHGGKWIGGGGVEELDENNDNEDELNENSMDLEPFAGNNNDNNENQQENWHAMDHNDDHHLNPDGNNEQQVHGDNNNEHQVNEDNNDDDHLNLDGNNEHLVNEDNNNEDQINEDNNNGHLMDMGDVPAANALPDVWQDPEDPGIFFQSLPEVGGFHLPPAQNVAEDNHAGANVNEEDQVVPGTAHDCFGPQQGLQILGGDLVQNFHDGMDNYPMCG